MYLYCILYVICYIFFFFCFLFLLPFVLFIYFLFRYYLNVDGARIYTLEVSFLQMIISRKIHQFTQCIKSCHSYIWLGFIDFHLRVFFFLIYLENARRKANNVCPPRYSWILYFVNSKWWYIPFSDRLSLWCIKIFATLEFDDELISPRSLRLNFFLFDYGWYP